jgi:hypothetical protein
LKLLGVTARGLRDEEEDKGKNLDSIVCLPPLPLSVPVFVLFWRVSSQFNNLNIADMSVFQL